MWSQVLCLCLTVVCVSGQADLANSYTPEQQPLNETALFVADALYKHPKLFRKLLNISAAVVPFMSEIDDPKISIIFDHFLDVLPTLLRSTYFINAVHVVADELHSVNISDVFDYLQHHHFSPDDPAARQKVTDAVFDRVDKVRTLQRLLSLSSARDILPLTANDSVTPSCYSHMMNFVDAIGGVQTPPRQDLNFTLVPWALKMLDSYGKVPSGIYEGNLHWVGSPDECRGIHAQMSAGVILGNTTLTSPFDFKGKSCRAEFQHPSWVSKLLQTHGALTWGVCVPDTCSEQDVKGLFQLGLMKNFKISPDNVSCPHVQKTTDHAHVTAGTTTPPSVTTNPFDLLMKLYSDCKNRIKPDEMMACLFSPCDLDKNGNISKREWQTESHKLGLSMNDHGKIARTFFQLDINRDLQIDAPDLKYLFAFFDDTGDGLLSLPEYVYNWQSLIS